MKTILRPLSGLDSQTHFLVGTKLLKKVKGDREHFFLEYKLVWANWDGEYRMLIRKLNKKSNRAEYGIIPERLVSGKFVVNISSLQRTLGKALKNWFIIEKNKK